MISVCFYFQIHQPFRIKKNYSFFDIDHDHFYEDDTLNREICNKVAQKCYIPATQMILDLIRQHEGRFRVSFSISGVALEQFERYTPEVIDLFRELNNTGCVEFINETYYHSLSFLFSKKEFSRQVEKHRRKIEALFGKTPTTFRNTELIYNNELAKTIEDMGYKTIITEGADHILGWRSPNYLYQPINCYKLKLLLKNYQLSDDIAFRFSNREWKGWPLTAEKYAHWLHSVAGSGDTINLFMDYETLGEHQWEDTGIFDFFRALPGKILEQSDFCFKTPAEVSAMHAPIAKINVPHFISWADLERDTTAWIGNHLQNSAIEYLYELEERVYATNDNDFIETWQKLQTSDHFYYMCTKWFSDGDVHKYFSHHNTPHEAFIAYMNILNDFNRQIEARLSSSKN